MTDSCFAWEKPTQNYKTIFHYQNKGKKLSPINLKSVVSTSISSYF